MILTFTVIKSDEVSASSSIKLIVDGEDLTNTIEPIIVNDRTLVPIRVVAEKLGAEVIWNNDERTVEITKGDSYMLLRIDSFLTEFRKDSVTSYKINDVQAKIINNRTYIPLRIVSNGLGVGIEWDNSTRTVLVDSTKTSSVKPLFNFNISSINNGQVITGKINLQSIILSTLPNNAKEIKYILLNPDTARGIVVARGNDFSTSYDWKPSLEDNGQRVLVAAIYDSNGKLICGDAIDVKIKINPSVKLKGISENDKINTTTALSTEVNFSASYVIYEMKNALTNEVVYTSPKWNPEDTFSLVPYMEDNDGLSIRSIAYDSNNNAYYSEFVNIDVNVTPEYSLKGVSNNQVIDKPVVLRASTNFNVSEIEYVLKDTATKTETVLKKVNSGSFEWYPTILESGSKELYIRIKDKLNNTYTSAPVYVTVSGTPKIMLQGAGPNQVVSGPMSLKVLSNVPLNSIKFIFYNPITKKDYVVAKGIDYLATYTYTPSNVSVGNWKIRAVGMYNSQEIVTEEVPITIYLGKTYGAGPIIEKSKFLDFASNLAVNTWEKTGMSAALQTAQAILETGWGQSVPVDKYNGQFSYNLFGIKGIGTKGSVTSNTWEEYNGVSYRIDDKFRAYNSVEESWDDHNDLLLMKERYGIYRDVMHDSTKGAWALRKAGYATDSSYPIKLMDIIKLYDLKKLDEIGI